MDSLVFAKPDANIHFANPDRSGQYQVTLDVTPSDPYFSPSEIAGGVIVWVRPGGAPRGARAAGVRPVVGAEFAEPRRIEPTKQ